MTTVPTKSDGDILYAADWNTIPSDFTSVEGDVSTLQTDVASIETFTDYKQEWIWDDFNEDPITTDWTIYEQNGGTVVENPAYSRVEINTTTAAHSRGDISMTRVAPQTTGSTKLIIEWNALVSVQRGGGAWTLVGIGKVGGLGDNSASLNLEYSATQARLRIADGGGVTDGTAFDNDATSAKTYRIELTSSECKVYVDGVLKDTVASGTAGDGLAPFVMSYSYTTATASQSQSNWMRYRVES